jgi:hypothetical protein
MWESPVPQIIVLAKDDFEILAWDHLLLLLRSAVIWAKSVNVNQHWHISTGLKQKTT